MNLLERILTPLGYRKAPAVSRPPAVALSAAANHRWDMPEAFVADRQAHLYAQLSWISTAIDRTADIAAGGLFSVKRIANEPGGGDDEDLPNHDFEKLLRRPNPSQSRGEFLRDAFTMFKVTGNLYIHLNRVNPNDRNSPPEELWIVSSLFMRPIPDGNSYIKGYEFQTPTMGTPVVYPPWSIMHLKTSNPLNQFVGLSAIQSLGAVSYGDLAQQKWNLAHFDKNNATLPIILAFKDMVAQPEWDRIKRERDNEWGGTNRKGVSLMRGVGDSLTLLQATTTQKEMEFLEGRAFTRSEIFGKLAPGLDSILAINATEANAIAGKSTLIEFGVWPVLDQLAQKITSDVLPLYEENLDGSFDDMRQTNRILDLQEQQEFAKYHTINEIRAEYYDEEPLYLDKSQEARLEEEVAVQDESKELALEARAQAPAAPAKQPPFGKADTAKPSKTLDPRGFLFVAQIGPATPLPGDTTKPAAPAMPPPPPPVIQQEGDAVPDKEQPSDGQAEELAKWEKFALARLGKSARAFVPRAVNGALAGRIQTALKAATTPDDVRAVFARERAGEASELARLADAIEKATAKL